MNNTINIIDENNSNNIIIHNTNPSSENEGEDKNKINPLLLLIDQILMKPKMDNDKKNDEDRKAIVIDYWNMSDSEFKQRLLTSVKNEIHHKPKIQQWLEVDPTVSQLGRQYSCLIANVYSLKMEQDFWKTYQSETRVEALWLSKMSKSMQKRSNISEAFFKTENFMNQHLKTIEKQSRKAIEKLDEHLQKQEEEQFFKLSTINKTLFSAAIIALVRQDQSLLYKKYEKQNSQLMLNVNDIRLVKEFYDLKPEDIQISYAARIWKTMIYEEYMKKELTNAKKHLLDDNKSELYSMLQRLMVDITHIIPTIREFKTHSLNKIILLAEMKVEEYLETIEKQKKSFLEYSQRYFSSAEAETMFNIIERRRKTLQQRAHSINDFSTIFQNTNDQTDFEDLTDDDDDDDLYDYLNYDL